MKACENLSLDNLPGEIFKDIPDYEGDYQISIFGRVKSLKRKGCPLILKPFLHGKGFYQIGLSKKSKISCIRVSVLIAMTFLDHKPDGNKTIVAYKNGDSLKCELSNIELKSHRSNSYSAKNPSSEYRGVYLHTRDKFWYASISFKGKKIHLGSFKEESVASEYYENALKAIENGTKIKIKKRKYTSKYKGVSWHKQRKKWVSYIWNGEKLIYIGGFIKEYDAHLAYQAALNSKGLTEEQLRKVIKSAVKENKSEIIEFIKAKLK